MQNSRLCIIYKYEFEKSCRRPNFSGFAIFAVDSHRKQCYNKKWIWNGRQPAFRRFFERRMTPDARGSDQNMKKVIALLLSALTLLPFLAGCGSDAEKKGATIPAYITAEVYNFDPQEAYTDDDYMKVASLLFEGLTVPSTNKKGWDFGMAKTIETRNDEKRGEYSLYINLRETSWSDGTRVKADDFVYAWKRLLDSGNKNAAAALLFDVRNAHSAKNGDCSIDSIGVVALSDSELEITFEGKTDVDAFLRNAASPALVPLRETVISQNGEFWASRGGTFLSNGPFTLTNLDLSSGTVGFVRNSYYYNDGSKVTDKYVKPHLISVTYNRGKTGEAEDLAAQLTAFENGEILYLGEIPMASRANYRNTAVVHDIASTLSCDFNVDNDLFRDARVRRALSLAVDRNALAELLVFAKPADGLVAPTVNNGTAHSSFRTGNAVLSVSADAEQAKALLTEAGVSGGSFTLTYKDTEADRAVAEYLKGVWEGLGFRVTLKALLCEKVVVKADGTETTYYVDTHRKAYTEGDFDAILVDVNMLSSDPFAVLAAFSSDYSGMGIEMESGNYDKYLHYTGFCNADYDAIIQRAYEEKDPATRAAVLHEAEQALLEQMPLIPLVYNQDAYLISSELSSQKTKASGFLNFAKLFYKNYTESAE